MKKIELFVEGKFGEPDRCEDAVVFNKHFACVIDGATSKSLDMSGDRSSGKIATELIKKSILKQIRKACSAKDFFEELTVAIGTYYKKKGCYNDLMVTPHKRCSASAICYSRFHREIWMVGDCQALVGQSHITNHKKIDKVTANSRAAFIQGELLSGVPQESFLKCDTGREFIIPLLRKQYYFQNNNSDSQYSYGVVDGFKIPEKYIKIIKVPENIKQIVLASDGYPVLRQSLFDTETELSKINKMDPLCIYDNVGTKGIIDGAKSFDDRAYLRIEI